MRHESIHTMRVTGGHHRGIPLFGPADDAIRPTSDKARLAVFNSLMSGRFDVDLDDAVVLDGTAGTGAMGIEALSRGARFVHFADSSKTSLDLVRKNLAKIKADASSYRLYPLAAERLILAEAPAHIIFLDPPYNKNLLPKMVDHLIAQGWANGDTLFVLEAAKNENPVLPLEILDRKIYGAAQVIYASTPV